MLMLLLVVALIVSWECTVHIQYILPVCLHVYRSNKQIQTNKSELYWILIDCLTDQVTFSIFNILGKDKCWSL